MANGSTCSTTAACCSPTTPSRATSSGSRHSARSRRRRRCSPTASCIGTENTGDAGGKFFIIRPHADSAEILDQDWLGTPQKSELIIASPIVARGRVYVTSMDAMYAIGPKIVPAGAAAAAVQPGGHGGPGRIRSNAALVTPTELILKPGESADLTVRAFDANGKQVSRPRPT